MSEHDDWLRLSEHQVSYLRRCLSGPMPSDVGSGTVSSLRRMGMITAKRIDGVTLNVITEYGRNAAVGK